MSPKDKLKVFHKTFRRNQNIIFGVYKRNSNLVVSVTKDQAPNSVVKEIEDTLLNLLDQLTFHRVRLALGPSIIERIGTDTLIKVSKV